MKFTVALWGKHAGVEVDFDANENGEIYATIDGQELDPRIVAWAVEYGFRQGIRDAAASEKDDDKRNAAALKRVDALVNNTLREGGGGGKKLSPIEREARAIAEREIRLAFDAAANAEWVATQMKDTGLSKADLMTAAIKAHLEANAERLATEAEANLAKAPVITLPNLPKKSA